MSRRYGKKGEYAQNETEKNYSSNYIIVYNKDITYDISKPNVHKACMYMQLSDPTYNNKKRKFFYVLLTSSPSKSSSEKKIRNGPSNNSLLCLAFISATHYKYTQYKYIICQKISSMRWVDLCMSVCVNVKYSHLLRHLPYFNYLFSNFGYYLE